MRKFLNRLPIALLIATGVPFVVTQATLAADGVTQVENFIRSIINVGVGLAGLVATVFFVAGGFGYITSSGNPERLERSKHTLLYAAAGLAIVIAAFAISNIVSGLATNAFGS